MDGILPINKPSGFTSFDVVAKMRGMTGTKKIGHSGTLDPMATGVLPLFLGSATKAVSVLPDEDKRYTASLRLGVRTDTQDITGAVTETRESRVTEDELRAALGTFAGRQFQTPPMFSAKKVDGTPLYDLAREGRTVEREPKEIEIYSIELVSFDPAGQCAVIDVSCGKGTFIRTLIDDLGVKLGVGATMTSLVRTRASGFDLSECVTLEEAQALCDGGKLEERLVSPARLFRGLPRLGLSEYDTHLYKNGVHLSLSKRGWKGVAGMIAVYGPDGSLLGISRMDEIADELKLLKLL